MRVFAFFYSKTVTPLSNLARGVSRFLGASGHVLSMSLLMATSSWQCCRQRVGFRDPNRMELVTDCCLGWPFENGALQFIVRSWHSPERVARNRG